ncbi:MAG: methyltransferase domain-containing protein [Alphaproteobacteria bacterium]|nr:methyltransferase domain-containing protein [Alphaproteobacteria bacterium]
MSGARDVAHSLLDDVLRRRRPLDEALAEGGVDGLESRDRAFARLLVATVLRRLGQLDALIAAFVEKPLPDKAGPVVDALRLGLAQLLILGTADHAAVDSSVRLLQGRFDGFKGLVNAVLRRAAREGAEMIKAQDAARLSTPDWLWDSWSRAYGTETAHAIAEAHLTEPPLDLSVRKDAWLWAPRLEAELLPTGTLRRQTAVVGELPGFADGTWWVQDAAAALPVRLLGEVAGRRVIDLCAAPGGKTLQLAAAGARVTAVDRSARRLERVRENLQRLKVGAELIAADATAWRPAEPPDAILVDAPCSATGTLRRHPDVAHLKSPSDVTRLAAVQDRLLDHAVSLLPPGGMLVYCVCSLEPEEGPQRIARLLDTGAPVELVPVTPTDVPSELASDGFLRTLPCHWQERGGMDGFFAARLRKV